MPLEATACPLCGWAPSEIEARVELMLDAAEEAGFDLGSLELRRRQIERELIQFTAATQ